MNQIYVAGSFSTKEEKDELLKMIDWIKREYPDRELYIPMEHFVPGGNDKDEEGNYIMDNATWARRVFQMDVDALNQSNLIIALYKGRYSGTGTAWELGYAYGIGIPVILYVAEGTNMNSLMIINSATKVIDEVVNQK